MPELARRDWGNDLESLCREVDCGLYLQLDRDDAFVRKVSQRRVYRTINGDASYALGKVTKKYQQKEEQLVGIGLWQQDMRGYIVDAAATTVALLSKTRAYPPNVTREVSY